MAGQAQRIQRGAGAIAGNHVVMALGDDGPFVLIAHLRKGLSASTSVKWSKPAS
jgi:hypothetical protein